ncbi:MAG: PIN domain-containing protein [Verrucomicrobia bacterium]|nr:MAG: PIN domain-containing protein [Verrucomicrobiota bacterium]
MSAHKSLETNVLLYAYDLDAPAKRAVALRLVEEAWSNPGNTAISVQVLQELHVNLTKRGITPLQAGEIVRHYLAWPVVDNTVELFETGLTEQARWQLSLWDAMILAAARCSGASVLFSEDFSDGQDYGGVRVVNPFR